MRVDDDASDEDNDDYLSLHDIFEFILLLM